MIGFFVWALMLGAALVLSPSQRRLRPEADALQRADRGPVHRHADDRHHGVRMVHHSRRQHHHRGRGRPGPDRQRGRLPVELGASTTPTRTSTRSGPPAICPRSTCRSTRRCSSSSRPPTSIHSFWVPDFLMKMDVVPGRANRFEVTPTVEGRYEGKCAELCGTYHSQMLFWVEVVSPEVFDAEDGRAEAGRSDRPAGNRSHRTPTRRTRATPESGRTHDPHRRTGHRHGHRDLLRRVQCRAGRMVVSWITSTDHKVIGYLYFITSFAFFLIGA